MPTQAEMTEVTKLIESRQSSTYSRQDGNVIETIDGDLGWRNLSDLEQRAVLELNVTWRGFATEQSLEVAGRVIEGLPRERWMEGIDAAPDRDPPLVVEGRVVEQIKALQARTFEVTLDSVETRMSWHELSNGTQDDLLARTVDWTGLATDDRSDVVMRVLQGHAPERWLDGVRIERIAERFEAMRLEAVPPDERAESAARQVERIKSMSFILEEGMAPEPCSDCFLPWWESLSREEQRAALMEHVDWSGIEDRRDGMIAAALHLDSPERLERQADEYFGMREMENRVVVEPPPRGWEVAEAMTGGSITRNDATDDYDRLLTLAAARRPANDNERGIDR